MNYFENFNEQIPMPPALPLGWTSTSTSIAEPWNRVLVSGIDNFAANSVATQNSDEGTTSTLESPIIQIGPLGGTLTFDNLFNLENFPAFISALVIQEDGKIIIGGNFTQVNGVARRNLARLNSDGQTVDLTFQVDTDSTVRALAIDSSNQMIYVGGFFSNIGGENINNLARISTTGVIDISFQPNPNSGVRDILIANPGPAGTLYIGGNFTFVNNVSRRRVAKLNYNGTLDLSFNSTLNFTSSRRVMALALDPSFGLLIGGAFQLTNGLFNIARLDPITGVLDPTFLGTTENSIDKAVNDVTLDLIGLGIFITGDFTTVNGTNRNMIAKLNRTDGTLNNTFDPFPAFSGPPFSGGTNVILHALNQILVVGNFTSPRMAIAQLDGITGEILPNPNFNILDGGIAEIVPNPIGTNNFIIGGSFANINGSAPAIALLSDINIQNNSVNESFNVNIVSDLAFDGMVLEIKIGTDPFIDIITAGGSFVQGGYNSVLEFIDNPLGQGRRVWSGLSAGTFNSPQFITSQVNLPLSAANQQIQLRWILGCDSIGIAPGQSLTRIDNISIIMNRPICILPGAMVKTDRGFIRIEMLKEGDYVYDEKGNAVKVLQNFKLPMEKPMKIVSFQKNSLGLSKPNGLLRITHGHPIKVNTGDREQNVENFLSKKNNIKNMKLQTNFVYNIVTKERVFVCINNVFVATWNQEELYKHMNKKERK